MRLPDATTLEAAIARALTYLHRAQLPHGEFTTLLGSSVALDDGLPDATPFATTFVMHALALAGDRPHVRDMRARGLAFLAGEVGLFGMCRYWSVREWKHCRVPPDLDDTSCISHALTSGGRRVPANRWIFRHCRNERGIFRTWIIPLSKRDIPLRLVTWLDDMDARRSSPPMPAEFRENARFAADVDDVPADDVDPVVNANVVRYLGECADTRASIAYLVDLVQRPIPEGFSRYYPDPLALLFMIARANRHGVPSLGAAAVAAEQHAVQRQHADGSFGPALDTALGASVLRTFAPDSDATARAAHALLALQRDDGAWDRWSLYGGPWEYWGSKELSTSIALDVLLQCAAAGPRA